jgi:two-component system nitrogen regulation sensor histidine kinase NtrY
VIVRQTGDLRRIVDEFSKFARMPEPETRGEDSSRWCATRCCCRKGGQPDVRFEPICRCTDLWPRSTRR